MMQTERAFPDDDEILRRLHATRVAERQLALISRAPVPHPGRGYLAEFLDVTIDGVATQLFAKHGAAVTSADRFRGGLVGGLAYEFAMQRSAHAVAQRGVATPFAAAGDRGEMSIFSARVHGMRLSDAKRPDGLAIAASWLGEFHRLWYESAPPTSHINRLDCAFLAQWREPALAMIGAHVPEADAGAATARYPEDIDVLLSAPTVLLHGDCYPSNALIDDTGVWLIDWELAALGAGEVDLATLALGWPAADFAACTSAYASARWPEGAPAGFTRRLLAARRYILLRILSLPPRPIRLDRYRRRVRLLLTLNAADE